MRKEKAPKRKATLSSRLTWMLSLFMVGAFMLLTGFASWLTISSMMEQQAENQKAIINMQLNELENYYSTLKSYSMSIRNDEAFMQLISAPSSDYSGELYVQTLLRNIYYSRNDISLFKIYLFNSGVNYSITSKDADVQTAKNPPDSQIPGYAESLSSNAYLYVAPSLKKGCLFTITRTIIDIATDKLLAVVVLEVDDSYFKALAKDYIGTGHILALLDSNNRLFYSTDSEVLNTTSMIHISPYLVGGAASDAAQANLKNTSYLLAYDTHPASDWRLVSLQADSYIYYAVLGVGFKAILAALSLTILGALLIFFFTNRCTKPLYSLANAMGDAAAGRTAPRPDLRGGAEVTLLSERYSELADRIAALTKQNGEAVQREHNLRLEALEASINPYFVCHVLQSVQLTAMLNGQDELQTMAQTLYSMLDYAIQAEERMSIAKEVEYAKEYLFLERMQVNDRLDYRITTDKNVNSIKVPKILLQPMAENALMRAIENHCDSVCIEIKIELCGNILVVVVEDNAGLTAAQLEEIKRQTGQTAFAAELGITGTGLANLAERINLMYGSDASFSSDRTKDEKVSLTLCIVQDDEP